MKKLVILSFLALFVLCGCARLKGGIPKSVQARGGVQSLVPGENPVLIVAGLKLLQDKRPKKDITYMASVRENISIQISDILEDTGIFSQINFPPSPEDNIIISGEIRKFSWNSFETMISYIPGLNVFNLFGLPSTRTHTEVEIYLELKDIESDKVILNFNEQFIKDSKYNIYNFKPNKANEELSYGFGVVLKRIKKRILVKKNLILDSAKPKTPKKPEPKAKDDLSVSESESGESADSIEEAVVKAE